MGLKQHRLVWRKSFRGPIPYRKGDTCWSTVRSKVADGIEFFILNVPRDHRDFDGLNEEFKAIHNKDWDGDYLVPCKFVQFIDNVVTHQKGENDDTP